MSTADREFDRALRRRLEEHVGRPVDDRTVAVVREVMEEKLAGARIRAEPGPDHTIVITLESDSIDPDDPRIRELVDLGILTPTEDGEQP